jgi:deoxyadenosine/deoxycytidine kinase
MAKHFVAVAGNIGVGKSTLTTMLSKKLGWKPYLETVAENPYLADFYQDMHAWSFHSQVFFLSRRLRHHRQLLDQPHSVVQDRSVYEDAQIFARNLYLQGYMAERDYGCYQEIYQTLTQILPPPDLVVYLEATPATLMERIALRGRDFESGMSVEYIKQLNALYEEWIDGFEICPVLSVPADRLDFVLHSDHLDLITDKVQAKLRGDQLVLF